jgi:hypothetical protein
MKGYPLRELNASCILPLQNNIVKSIPNPRQPFITTVSIIAFGIAAAAFAHSSDIYDSRLIFKSAIFALRTYMYGGITTSECESSTTEPHEPRKTLTREVSAIQKLLENLVL